MHSRRSPGWSASHDRRRNRAPVDQLCQVPIADCISIPISGLPQRTSYVDFDSGGRHRQLRCGRARTDVLRPGHFLCSPDDASARLVPHQPRPVVRDAEMRRHPVRSPRSLGFSIFSADLRAGEWPLMNPGWHLPFLSWLTETRIRPPVRKVWSWHVPELSRTSALAGNTGRSQRVGDRQCLTQLGRHNDSVTDSEGGRDRTDRFRS